MRDASIYHQFLDVSKLTRNKTHEYLDVIGLYKGQPPLLFALLERDGQSRKELCEALSSQPATISKMIKRLENNGFVTSRPDLYDSRISRVYVTQKGRDIKEEVDVIFEKLTGEVFAGFSDEDIRQFRDYLFRMKANILKK